MVFLFVIFVFLCFYHDFVQHANLEINQLHTFLCVSFHLWIPGILSCKVG